MIAVRARSREEKKRKANFVLDAIVDAHRRLLHVPGTSKTLQEYITRKNENHHTAVTLKILRKGTAAHTILIILARVIYLRVGMRSMPYLLVQARSKYAITTIRAYTIIQ